MFQTTVVEKIKTHILLFFFKSCSLWDNLWKYGRAGQATDDNKIGASVLHAGWQGMQTHTQNM